MQELEKRGAVVLGLSGDTIESHEKFKEKYELNFPLVSDPQKKIMEKYGVLKEKNMYGTTKVGINRSTFVINEEGEITTIFRDVKVDGHLDEVLEVL